MAMALAGVTLTRPCWARAIDWSSGSTFAAGVAGEAPGAVRVSVLVLLMVLNSNQKFLGPKKKEEGMASLFFFLGCPGLGRPSAPFGADRLQPGTVPSSAPFRFRRRRGRRWRGWRRRTGV